MPDFDNTMYTANICTRLISYVGAGVGRGGAAGGRVGGAVQALEARAAESVLPMKLM